MRRSKFLTSDCGEPDYKAIVRFSLDSGYHLFLGYISVKGLEKPKADCQPDLTWLHTFRFTRLACAEKVV
jgi:hypothetical protein